MLWILRDLMRAIKDFIKMLRDKSFWKIFRESLKDLGQSPYG
jgi:hypothetical protein